MQNVKQLCFSPNTPIATPEREANVFPSTGLCAIWAPEYSHDVIFLSVTIQRLSARVSTTMCEALTVIVQITLPLEMDPATLKNQRKKMSSSESDCDQPHSVKVIGPTTVGEPGCDPRRMARCSSLIKTLKG
jgi:hypothetical protein